MTTQISVDDVCVRLRRAEPAPAELADVKGQARHVPASSRRRPRRPPLSRPRRRARRQRDRRRWCRSPEPRRRTRSTPGRARSGRPTSSTWSRATVVGALRDRCRSHPADPGPPRPRAAASGPAAAFGRRRSQAVEADPSRRYADVGRMSLSETVCAACVDQVDRAMFRSCLVASRRATCSCSSSARRCRARPPDPLRRAVSGADLRRSRGSRPPDPPTPRGLSRSATDGRAVPTSVAAHQRGVGIVVVMGMPSADQADLRGQSTCSSCAERPRPTSSAWRPARTTTCRSFPVLGLTDDGFIGFSRAIRCTCSGSWSPCTSW